MQAYFDQRGHFYQASAILDSTLEDVWREKKRRPRLFKNLETHQVQNHFTLHSSHIVLTVVLIPKIMRPISTLRVLKKFKCSTSKIKT